MHNFRDVRAKFFPDLGQKWQKNWEDASHKIDNDTIPGFLTKMLFKKFLIWAFEVKMWVQVGSKMAKKRFFFIPATFLPTSLA